MFSKCFLFKSDHFCKFHKIVIRPNIQLFGIPDKRQHVSLYLIHVCRGKSFIQFLKERLLVKLFVIELQGSFAQVSKVKRNIVSNIPFEVIPITSLDSVLPGTIHQCMHLSCKEGWQSETSCHERLGEQKQLLFCLEFQRRLSIFSFGASREKSISSEKRCNPWNIRRHVPP